MFYLYKATRRILDLAPLVFGPTFLCTNMRNIQVLQKSDFDAEKCRLLSFLWKNYIWTTFNHTFGGQTEEGGLQLYKRKFWKIKRSKPKKLEAFQLSWLLAISLQASLILISPEKNTIGFSFLCLFPIRKKFHGASINIPSSTLMLGQQYVQATTFTN